MLSSETLLSYSGSAPNELNDPGNGFDFNSVLGQEVITDPFRSKTPTDHVSLYFLCESCWTIHCTVYCQNKQCVDTSGVLNCRQSRTEASHHLSDAG